MYGNLALPIWYSFADLLEAHHQSILMASSRTRHSALQLLRECIDTKFQFCDIAIDAFEPAAPSLLFDKNYLFGYSGSAEI